MAIALDQVLGFDNTTGSFSTRTLTTTAAAAAGSRVIVQVSCWDSAAAPTITCTIGGVAATLDGGPFVNPDQRSWIFSLHVAGGLASGSSIVVTLSVTVIALEVNASSYTGIQSTAGYVEASASGTGSDTTHWLSGSVTTASAEAMLFAFATSDNHTTSTTSAPTSPAVEVFDFWLLATTEATTVAYKVVTPGTYTVGGTWSTADAQHIVGVVAYKGTATAQARPWVPHRMPQGV